MNPTLKTSSISRSLLKKDSYIKIISNDLEIKKARLQVVKKILDIQSNLHKGKLTFDYGGRPVRAMPSDIIRVVSQTKTSSDIEETFKNIFLNAFISLEKRSIFSSSVFLRHFAQEEKRETYQLRATKDDVFYLVSKYIGKGFCFEIFKEIFDNSGTFTDLEFIESNNASGFEVRMSGGIKIEGDIDMLFSQYPKSIEDASVICFDGIVEKVSEIHSILESSASENKSLVIFAHGFSPDVSNTLFKNYESGSLKVFPFVVKDKENSWKKFEEANYFTVKRENFRQISMIKVDDLSQASEVDFENGSCIIYDEKIENMKSTIIIPKIFKNQAGLIEDRIRSSFEYAKDISKHGIVLDELGRPKISVMQKKESLKSFKSFKNFIEDLGCVVSVF